MGENNPKPQARTGHLYSEGPNPYPGGKVDTGDSPVPPYEGRTQGPGDTESTKAKTESIERQLADTASAGADAEAGQVKSPGGENIDPATGESLGAVSADEVSHRTPDDPHGVGTSSSRRGEDVKKQEGTEPGRQDLGTKGQTERPYGSTSPRDSTGVNPERSDIIDDDMMQTGGSGIG